MPKTQNQDDQEVNTEPEKVEVDQTKPDEPTATEATDEASKSGGLGDSEQVLDDDKPPKPAGKFKRFFAGYWHKKKWTLPLTALVILGILFGLPASRYPLLALGMKRSFVVTVTDSKTGKTVSGAAVTLEGQTLETGSSGAVAFHVKVGKATLQIAKKYYKSLAANVFVGISTTHNADKVQLVATGRQVPIKVVNKITGQPVAGADIKVLDTEATTDANGQTIIVLPTNAPTQSATITASNYNDAANLNVQVTSNVVSGNTFSLTPSGRVYFLSNLSGNIDVVSTNLDGSARKTILAGTGQEDPNNTVLLASRDWKYLALLSKRDGGQNAKLFLINTSTNQTTSLDAGPATFTPVGWEDHYFVYQADRTSSKLWQPGQSVLKSFNADTGRTITLDQTAAAGSSSDNYTGQDFGYNDTYAIGNQIVYIKEWGQGYQANPSQLNGKQDQILSVAPDGSSKQVLKGIALSSNNNFQGINSVEYNPVHIYFQVSNASGNTYYDYADGALTQSNTVTDNSFQQDQQNYATYLQSPSGRQTFWSEPRDGKNTLFVGDSNGANGKQIATLSDYAPYGWYTDNYLLVEKNGSELYVMSTSGGGAAIKVSDYYKPQRTFYGYGGGYGGL